MANQLPRIFVGDESIQLIGGCYGTRWGCCDDGLTSAWGPMKEGCPETEMGRTMTPPKRYTPVSGEAVASGLEARTMGALHSLGTQNSSVGKMPAIYRSQVRASLLVGFVSGKGLCFGKSVTLNC